MTNFNDKFKQTNAYYLHQKYPERDEYDNWLHSCEILNRFKLGRSYLILYNFKQESYSTRQWHQNLILQIHHSNLNIYVDTPKLDIQVASFPLPIELPEYWKRQGELIVKVDSFISKKLVIEN